MEHCCDSMVQVLNDKRVYFDYQSQYRRYYINTDSKAIIHRVHFCPWCGEKLPKDLKNEYFKTLEKEYGIDDPHGRDQAKLISE